MLLVQGNDGAFYGEPCAKFPSGGYIAMDDDDGCRIVLPRRVARGARGATKAGRRVLKALGLTATILDGVHCSDVANAGKPGWVIPFELEDWIDPSRFEYSAACGWPSLNIPFIAFRMVFGKQVIIDALGLERVPPLLTKWLTPGPGYVRRSREDYLALVAQLTPLLPNYARYKSIESYLAACPNQVPIDRRRKSRRVAPKTPSVGGSEGEERGVGGVVLHGSVSG